MREESGQEQLFHWAEGDLVPEIVNNPSCRIDHKVAVGHELHVLQLLVRKKRAQMEARHINRTFR